MIRKPITSTQRMAADEELTTALIDGIVSGDLSDLHRAVVALESGEDGPHTPDALNNAGWYAHRFGILEQADEKEPHEARTIGMCEDSG